MPRKEWLSLGVQDILPWVTVEWLLQPLLVEGVPVNQGSTFFQTNDLFQSKWSK